MFLTQVFLKGPESITCDLPEGKSGTLIYAPDINDHFLKIMNDITAVKRSPNLNINGDALEPEKERDDYSPWLKRDNSLLYGTPGTGKTVFVEELVHHLYQQFGKPLEDRKIEYLDKIVKIKKEIETLEKNPESEENRKKIGEAYEESDRVRTEMNVFTNKNLIPPVIQINGEKVVKVAGLDTNSPTITDMIVEIIKAAKKVYFKDEYSKEPYVVFFEEADEMGEMIGKKEGNYLKDLKSWLSTSEDMGGLSTKAQDPNSIIIAATNHFERLEPGAVRRGRLGKTLNFNWNPQIVEDYSKEGGKTTLTDDDGNKRYLSNGIEVAWPFISWPKNDLAWKFQGNANYPELTRLCEKIGYSTFKDKFAPKTIQILADYANWKRTKPKELEEKAKKELGLNIPTGKKVPSGKKNEDGSDIMKDELICNWMLHYLWTFHYYNDGNKLHLFNSISDVMRYGFDNEFLNREKMDELYHQMGAQVDQTGLIYTTMKKMYGELSGIKRFMAEAHDLRQEVANLKANISDNERLIEKVKEGMQTNLRILENRIDSLNMSSQVSELVGKINSLQSQINSLGSSGGGGSSSSGGVSADSYNQKIRKIEDLKDLVHRLLEAVKNNNTSTINSLINEFNLIANR